MSSGEGGGGKLLLSEGHEGGPGAEVEAEGIRGLHSVGEKQLEELFNRLDKNKDGKIDVQELKDAMESMGHLSKTQAQMKRFLHEEGRPLRVWERLLAGSTAGVIAQTVIYPMEVLKTRLALGQTGQYRGIFDCAKQILRVEGPRAFYKGISPSLVGIIPYAGIDFTIYELLKNFWLSRHDLTDPGVLVPLACGTVSSTCGQVASYPLSLVRTRLQSQVTPLKGGAVDGEKALGMAETIQLISRTEGLRGLYRGILPNFLKVIPSVSIGYLVYEKLKLLLGVQTIR